MVARIYFIILVKIVVYFWNALHVFFTQADFYSTFRRHSGNIFLSCLFSMILHAVLLELPTGSESPPSSDRHTVLLLLMFQSPLAFQFYISSVKSLTHSWCSIYLYLMNEWMNVLADDCWYTLELSWAYFFLQKFLYLYFFQL